MVTPAKLDAYIARLKRIPFVRGVSISKRDIQVGQTAVDARVSIKTPTGREDVYLEVKTSNMSNALASQVVSLSRGVKPLLVAAPVIGQGTGDMLAQHSVSFVDMRGNCYLNLGGRYIARIQGQRGERPSSARALRAPSYQVLFALLADPALLVAPIRTLAIAAGVSRQPAMTLRERLVDLDIIVRTKKGYAWTPVGEKRALDLWLSGYATTVRPSLLVGTYRTPDVDVESLEARIRTSLDARVAWRWGGGAAAERLTRYYRGEKTVLLIAEARADLPKLLRAVPDSNGSLTILRSPGPAALKGATTDTVHPLLVYSELLTVGGERAVEAADRVAKRFAIGRTN